MTTDNSPVPYKDHSPDSAETDSRPAVQTVHPMSDISDASRQIAKLPASLRTSSPISEAAGTYLERLGHQADAGPDSSESGNSEEGIVSSDSEVLPTDASSLTSRIADQPLISLLIAAASGALVSAALLMTSRGRR
ncbi:MAG: hypothetical protein ABIW85_09390 [Variovorax sp.]